MLNAVARHVTLMHTGVTATYETPESSESDWAANICEREFIINRGCKQEAKIFVNVKKKGKKEDGWKTS